MAGQSPGHRNHWRRVAQILGPKPWRPGLDRTPQRPERDRSLTEGIQKKGAPEGALHMFVRALTYFGLTTSGFGKIGLGTIGT